jgi:predicted RNase H-like HicB family nuclease
MPKQKVHVVIYKDNESNAYVAFCLEYDVSTQGDNEEHALEMIREAVELHIEDMSAEDLERIFIPVDSKPTVHEINISAPALLNR